MKTHYPKSLKECLKIKNDFPKSLLLAGGTDINIMIKKKLPMPEDIIYINHIPELHEFKIYYNELKIGASVTIDEIHSSQLVKKNFPYLSDSLKDFASPLIANLASIGGNIANASPTADTVPLLLILNSSLTLQSVHGKRKVTISDFFEGYKKLDLKPEELIVSINIPLSDPECYKAYYAKTGSRKILTIAKTAIAFLKDEKEFRVAAGSLAPFPCRLTNVEIYLNSQDDINDKDLMTALKNDVTPITDFRSDADYRLQVSFNYIKKFYEEAKHEFTR